MIRQQIFKTRRGRPYRMLFLQRNDVVFVLHIRGPRQNLMLPEDIQLPEE